ncbi:MAG: GGDEF domain-containing protein [Gammaproteobacteria bacterium]|nr:GGDEF domain-containing protein [Gammaproteobacteria bacterium]
MFGIKINKAKQAATEPGIEQWMFREKVIMLYQNQTQSWLVSIFASAILAYLSLESNNGVAGFSWWAVFVAITLFRTWNTRRFCHFYKAGQVDDIRHWYNRFYVSTVMAGIAWGAGGFIIGIPLDAISQVFIFIVLIGVGAAAIPLLGVMQRIMLCFQAVSTIPYAIYISIMLGDRGTILLYMFVLYSIGVVASMRRMDLNLTESMKLQYENSQMVNTLSESNQQLQNANEKLETLTLEDALTGLHNRRYFEMQLEFEWKRESREKKVLTLMVIDIDYFKLYNDTYGHAEGDVCLKRVSHILESSLHRSTDVIARIGGEEFVVMLPNINIDGALTLAKQMQQQLHQAGLTHATSPLGDNVTVSIGIASVIPDDNATALGLFKAADKALYKAKTKGRNQVVIGEMDLT